MALAHLSIGTADDRIDLLSRDGFHLYEWTPLEVPHETVYAESALADGRYPVYRRDLNVQETFNLVLRADSADHAATFMQRLRRLCRQAAEYFASDNPSLLPVYLACRAACETNMRYALVFDASVPQDSNYFAQPFISRGRHSGMDNLLLVVEHAPWTDTAPGGTTCVQISGEQTWAEQQAASNSMPSESGDDAHLVLAPMAQLDLESDTLYFGYVVGEPSGPSGPLRTGIRFRNVEVDIGSVLISAKVDFKANNTDSMQPMNVVIRGEKNVAPAIFTDRADFMGRAMTDASVQWDDIPPWTADRVYGTPDLRPIIQEIINMPGWAAGNDLVLFFDDYGTQEATCWRRAYSWDSDGKEPMLTIVYGSEVMYGRSATCLNEVYVANKHNQAQLTHVYRCDGGVFSENLIDAPLPFNLLPSVPENNDALYFGIQSISMNGDSTNTGPFSNIVFDIASVAEYREGAYLQWQYWNGAAWTNLTVQDNTDNWSGVFTKTGVNSVHWVQPSNWTPVAVNGVTGWWVRLLVVIPDGGSIPEIPQQQNRALYTTVRPCVDIAADQVGGDMPALAQVLIQNQSSAPLFDAPKLYSTQVLLALRSTDRGLAFTPFINLANGQNPAGIGVAVYGNTTFVSTPRSATGRASYFNSTGASSYLSRVAVSFYSSIVNEYYGKYRAFVRGWQAEGGTAGNVTIRLLLRCLGSMIYTPAAAFTDVNVPQLLDMGTVALPPGPLESGAFYEGMVIYIQASSTAAAEDAYLTELILMPLDEWAGEFVWPTSITATGWNSRYSTKESFLDVDSITYPKYDLRAIVRQKDSNAASSSWECRCPQRAILLNGKQQRLWMLFQRVSSLLTSALQAQHEIAHSVQIKKQQRYSTLRGDA